MSMSIPEMLQKLDDMYCKEEKLVDTIMKLKKQYDQLQDDKQLLQQMIMHQSNKKNRFKQ